MNLARILALLAAAALPARDVPRPAIGLAIEFEKPPTAEAERQAYTEVRETGVNLFALAISWSEAASCPAARPLSGHSGA